MEKFLKYDIKPTIIDDDAQYAKLVFAPLERGFGNTLGNALRRTMLSNIPGASVFAIKIPKVTHEFQAIDGVKEDVTQIVLNLKNLVIAIDENVYPTEELSKLSIEKWPTLKIDFNGSGEIYAKDIETPAGFSVINKDLYICTVTANRKFNLEIYATMGRGFRTFNENRELINSLSIIATDSNFSPILRVGYTVEEQKISKTELADVLTLEVATNGSIKPQDAVALAANILIGHLTPIVNINQAIANIDIMQEKSEEHKTSSLSIPIEELDLTVRSYNCLKRMGIQTIQELTNMNRSEVEKIKNLGKKSLREIQKKLVECGLTFKND